jgi:hypothetical protein
MNEMLNFKNGSFFFADVSLFVYLCKKFEMEKLKIKGLNLTELLDKLKNSSIQHGSSVCAIPLDEALNGSTSEVYNKFIKGEHREELFNFFTSKIEEERDAIIDKISKFYFTKSTYTNFHEDGLSPEEIYKLVEEDKIRVKRLLMIFKPDVNSTITTKPNNDTYDLVKINWINEKGETVRVLSKSYGRVGVQGLYFSVPKFVGEHFENVTSIESDYKYIGPNNIQRVADLMAEVNGTKWIFEIKSSNKKDFMIAAVRFELWELYKKKYLL